MPLFRRSSGTGDDGKLIVVGLANPGPRYNNTRHNVGAEVLEVLRERMGASLKTHKSGCLTAEGRLAGQPVVLARATSYMNESGRPVGQLMRWYKTDPANVIVVHDEIDIPFGDVRVKFGGGTAGHNGLKSLGNHFGTKEFPRVRVGVSRPPGRQDPADYVLSEFRSEERKELPSIIERAADAVEAIVEHGVERAMNTVNTR